MNYDVDCRELTREGTTKLCLPCVKLYYNFHDEFFKGYSGKYTSVIAV